MPESNINGARHATSSLDALVRASKTPGIQYVVVDAGGTVFEYCGGSADIQRHAPVDAETTMMAYSMSKTITAAAVLQLAERGQLDLDSPAERCVESFPYGRKVTIRQLVSHTSGVPNPIPLRWVHAAATHQEFDETAALAKVLRDHWRLSFEPGTRYAYSNIGYWLLGTIIARASGQAFQSYVNREILRPLGIPPDELGYEIADAAHHANGYLEKYSFMNLIKGFLIDKSLIGGYERSWLRIQSHYPNGAAFGGLVGSARGFARFLQDQLQPKSVLFDQTTRGLFYAPQQITRERLVPMTLGWHIGQLRGETTFYKEGGGGGFHSMMRVYPQSEIATVIMTNATGFDVRACLDHVDVAFLRRSPIQ